MKKEMLINVLQPEECRIAILEDGVLEELYAERTSQESYVGNIYKGRIVNIEPSIQAAFVDFGIGRNGFLHVSDVEPTYYRHLEPRRAENGGRRGGRRGRSAPRSRPPAEEEDLADQFVDVAEAAGSFAEQMERDETAEAAAADLPAESHTHEHPAPEQPHADSHSHREDESLGFPSAEEHESPDDRGGTQFMDSAEHRTEEGSKKPRRDDIDDDLSFPSRPVSEIPRESKEETTFSFGSERHPEHEMETRR